MPAERASAASDPGGNAAATSTEAIAAPPSVGVLREAVREAVTRSSVRAVADAVGMSSSGLHSFLAGGRPYARTIRLLTIWLARSASGRSGEASSARSTAADVDLSLARLVNHLPDGYQQAARRRILATVRTETERAGVEAPPWLEHVTRPSQHPE